MTNKEAIEELKPLTRFSIENGVGNFPMVWRPSQVEALNLAIKALEEQERPRKSNRKPKCPNSHNCGDCVHARGVYEGCAFRGFRYLKGCR